MCTVLCMSDRLWNSDMCTVCLYCVCPTGCRTVLCVLSVLCMSDRLWNSVMCTVLCMSDRLWNSVMCTVCLYCVCLTGCGAVLCVLSVCVVYIRQAVEQCYVYCLSVLCISDRLWNSVMCTVCLCCVYPTGCGTLYCVLGKVTGAMLC